MIIQTIHKLHTVPPEYSVDDLGEWLIVLNPQGLVRARFNKAHIVWYGPVDGPKSEGCESRHRKGGGG